MELPPEEPAAGPWRVEPVGRVLRDLRDQGALRTARPLVLGIDGRSSSGKTTLSRRIRDTATDAEVVHTDDVAWHHSVFGWVDLLVEGVLEPVRRGQPVSFRPPAWERRGRGGAIEVSAGVGLLVVEGVGVGQCDLAPELDVLVWVQSDLRVTRRRDAERIASGEVTEAVYEEWMAEEKPFLADQRPWERADLVVAGTSHLPHDPRTEVVVSG